MEYLQQSTRIDKNQHIVVTQKCMKKVWKVGEYFITHSSLDGSV